jgi:hypothetical protein
MPQNCKVRGGKHFFFEKKKQKTFVRFGFGLSGEDRPRLAKVFWFFFSKKNRFLPSPIARPTLRHDSMCLP